MNAHAIDMVVTIMISVLGSSGLWAYIQKRSERKDASRLMLLGLGHDLIIARCEEYIQRGWLTHDEYENLCEYLYKPYKAMGGNGTAERLMTEVNSLPLRASKSDSK